MEENPGGFTLKAFNFTASRLSRFFYSKGVNSNEEFVRVWNRDLLPLMDQNTGTISTVMGDPDECNSQSPSQTNQTHSQTLSPPTGSLSSRLVSSKRYIQSRITVTQGLIRRCTNCFVFNASNKQKATFGWEEYAKHQAYESNEEINNNVLTEGQRRWTKARRCHFSFIYW